MNSTAQQGRSERDSATGRLLRAYKNDGDIRARDRLVALYLPLVETFAQRYRRPGAERDDLVQAGSIGLLNAIERFDAGRGDEFAAFAVPTVVGEMKRHIRDRSTAVKLPRRLQDASAALPAARQRLTARLEREPTDDELAAELEIDPVELARVREPSADGDVADLPDESESLELSDERLMLAGAFRALDDTERSIVYLRFVRDLGQADVAAQLGMSERQLARRTRNALAKLRGEIEGGGAPRAAAPTRDGPAPTAHDAPTPTAGDAPAAPTARDARTAPSPAAPNPRAGESSAPVGGETADSDAAGRKSAHSGRLLLRMPQSLHAELARAAEREDISLNQFITNSLAAAVGWRRPDADGHTAEPDVPEAGPPSPTPEPGNGPPRWLRAALVTNVVVVAIAALVAVILLLVAWQQGF